MPGRVRTLYAVVVYRWVTPRVNIISLGIMMKDGWDQDSILLFMYVQEYYSWHFVASGQENKSEFIVGLHLALMECPSGPFRSDQLTLVR